MSFKASSAKNPNSEGIQYHLRLKKGDIPTTVLSPGDPGRVQKIAELWDSSKEVANYRQYHSMKGMIGKTPIACVSSGIGAPGLAIELEELARIGTKTVIRVGTCGSLQKDIHLGDVIISTGAVRLDGASKDYVRPEFPAIADYRVVSALIQAAEELKIKHHVGITASTDTFYCGQGRPGFNNYLPSFQERIFDDMQKAGVKNFEMEASCLFTLGSLFNLMTGCVCVVIADRVRDKFGISDEMEMLPAKVANRAAQILIKSGK